MCNCGAEIETTKHFLLRCYFLASERQNLYDNLFLIDPSIISFDEKSLLNAPLYVSGKFDDKVNREIPFRSIYYISNLLNVLKNIFLTSPNQPSPCMYFDLYLHLQCNHFSYNNQKFYLIFVPNDCIGD